VFDDPEALADLNAIVHPPVRAAIAARLAELEQTGAVVVLEIPLLVESGMSYGASRVIVVDCPEEVAVRRLVEERGMEESDARRRIAAQASRSQRLEAADIVIDNRGSLDDLRGKVDAVWRGLTRE
jgi:dephospho-CoA kinase